MAIRVYAGTARPFNTKYEDDPNFEKVEQDEPDASIARGYRNKTSGELVSMASGVVPSAARLAASAQSAADRAASDAQIATFRQSIRDLAQAVKDNTATAAQQRQLLVKLARVADNVLADL